MKFCTFLLTLYFISYLAPADSKGILPSRRNALPQINEHLIVRLYRRGSSENGQKETCEGSCEKITFKKLSLNKPIKIIIHGWRGHEKSVLFKELVKAYLDNVDYNIITIDWSQLGSKDLLYPSARSKVSIVASKFAKFLNSLKEELGVKLEDLHIIGHSLGAHIAGIAAYEVPSGKIGRITGLKGFINRFQKQDLGSPHVKFFIKTAKAFQSNATSSVPYTQYTSLDPAGPQFSEEAPRERLSTESALFVDVIHTSANYLGFGGPLGHVDFYPNGPHMLQPGCGFDIIGRCSHRRSFYFYAESIAKPNAFLAVPCADWVHYQKRECDVGKVVPMGESTPATARGTYYLATNKKSPFGTGTIWENNAETAGHEDSFKIWNNNSA